MFSNHTGRNMPITRIEEIRHFDRRCAIELIISIKWNHLTRHIRIIICMFFLWCFPFVSILLNQDKIRKFDNYIDGKGKLFSCILCLIITSDAACGIWHVPFTSSAWFSSALEPPSSSPSCTSCRCGLSEAVTKPLDVHVMIRRNLLLNTEFMPAYMAGFIVFEM